MKYYAYLPPKSSKQSTDEPSPVNQGPARPKCSVKDWEEDRLWFSIPFTIGGAGLILACYWLAWNYNLLHSPQWRSLWFFPMLLVSTILHEGLHGLADHFFGHAPWKTINLRFKKWPYLYPFVITRAPMTMAAHRFSLLLPLVVLGLLPSLIGVVLGLPGLTLFGVLNCIIAGGDMADWWMLRRYPADYILGSERK